MLDTERNERRRSKKACPNHSEHPDHAADLVRLKRILGQLQGIEKMILDRRYCMDILQQAKAARSALNSFELSILRTHLKGCVRDALSTKNSFDAENKIKEITDLLSR